MPESGLRAALLDRLEARRSRVAIIGLGYVGLPLAVAAARAGHTVVGIDADPDRVATVNRGRSHVEDVKDTAVAGLVGERRLSASTSYSAAAGCDVAVIAVPTPIDRHRVPNLSYVRSAAGSIAAALGPGSLVVLESTTYPGTTEEVLVPALEQRGLRPGQDVFVGYSPERIDPSNSHFTIANTPKVVAGLTEDCLQAAAAFYATFVERLVPVSSLKAAEITKLFENIFRVVNIALYEPLEEFAPETWRRSVYRQSARAIRDDLMASFDCPECAQRSPRRDVTTTPLQALSLLNGPFVIQQADFFARRVRQEAGDHPGAQVDRAFQLAFGRPAGATEQRAALELVEKHGLPALCRALLNANEFLYY